MTSEKAVETLRKIKVYATGDDLEALDMAIESIIYDYARGVQKGLEIATIKGNDKRKIGHWIDAYPDIEPNPMLMYAICSVCGCEQAISDKLNFCPDCGSDMRGTGHV